MTKHPPHGLGYSHEAIDAIIAGRKSITAQEQAQAAQPIAAPGGDRKSKATRENQGDVVTLKTGRGNDPAYLTARIARDRPDILEKMKAGKYSSTRQAAVEAIDVHGGSAHPTDQADTHTGATPMSPLYGIGGMIVTILIILLLLRLLGVV